MSDPSISLRDVGKMYRIYPSRSAHMLDALGIGRLLPRRLTEHQEFWAIRGVDLELGRGDRLGIIGRNGAGKTTLLKLLTGNLAPSQGQLEVRGSVQSLLDASGGLHPEFSGVENIRAALTYQGMGVRQIRELEAEIAEFTELGDFIRQPFKTYSLGMQARLAFTIATAVRPEILIVDEMLGAGDAYFFGKSTGRMQALVDSGATVLIVSHALDQVVRFCDQAIWMDRGQVVARGPALDVVKAYERFVRVLEDRRLRGKNFKVASNRFRGLQSEGYADSVLVRMTLRGPAESTCDVAEVGLFRDDVLEDRVLVGSAQDADAGQSSHVVLESGAWSAPMQDASTFYRRLTVGDDAPEAVDVYSEGAVKILCWAFEDQRDHTVELRYRASAGAWVSLEVVQNNEIVMAVPLAPAPDWKLARFDLHARPADPPAELAEPAEPAQPEPPTESPTDPAHVGQADGRPIVAPAPGQGGGDPSDAIVNLSRWPGEGSLVVEAVDLLGDGGREQTVFSAGGAMRIRVQMGARRSGRFSLIMASLIFRLDGIVVTRHIGKAVELEMTSGEVAEAELDLSPVNLGNGYYVLSIGLYRKLDLDDIEAPEIYDYLDRSYEFSVVGNPRLHNELFRHPAQWRVQPTPGARPGRRLARTVAGSDEP